MVSIAEHIFSTGFQKLDRLRWMLKVSEFELISHSYQVCNQLGTPWGRTKSFLTGPEIF